MVLLASDSANVDESNADEPMAGVVVVAQPKSVVEPITYEGEDERIVWFARGKTIAHTLCC